MGIENPVHLLFVAAVALLVLGPKRLPEVARTLGKGIREFREALSVEASPHEAVAREPAASPVPPPAEPIAPPPAPAPPAEPTAAPAASAPPVDPAEPVRSEDAPDRRPL